MAKTKYTSTKKHISKNNDTQRIYLSQADVPSYSLEEAIKVASALYEFGSKNGTPPHEIANELSISPTSTNWRYLSGSAVAYGLTTGGSNAAEISLTPLGLKVVAPEEEGEDENARLEAGLRPKLLKDFFNRFNRQKFPKDSIAKNVLVSMGVSKDKVDKVYSLVLANGKFTKVIQDTKTGLFVYVDARIGQQNMTNEDISMTEITSDAVTKKEVDNDLSEELAQKMNLKKEEKQPEIASLAKNEKPKVFISHGKNKKIVEQLKEILTFGQFDVTVSVEKEATAISVPDKVFSDMRNCDAAVIHVEGERELLDQEGNVHYIINENVLIEIGAAIALYGKKFILLCEHSIKLPSNLQGLYRCNYEGKELSYEATMKLLKAFNEFRQKTNI